MLFVQRDHMVQNLSTTASDPTFGGSILPGRLDAGPFWLQTRRLQKRRDLSIEFGIAVQDNVTVWASFRKGLPQLLDHPLRIRMSSDVQVQDLPASVLDDEEAVEQLERHRRHSEEVERYDCLAMVLKKRQPTLPRIAAAVDTSEIASHTPLGDLEAEFQKLAMNFGRSPTWILFGQVTN